MLLNNKGDIKDLLDAIYVLAKNDTDNIESKLCMYQFCASSFWHNYSGTFAHYQLEEDLREISNEIIDYELNNNFQENHILHIMTEAYNTGGHTRVVENWIKATPHVHSVFLNNPFSDQPSFLVEAVADKKGSIIINDKNGFVEKARFLAQIASGFKYVVLHHHPHDILPLISFGTKKFLRPIFFYNHADHVWGCGYSVSDYVIEICEQGVHHSIKYRGIPENKVIFAGIPITLPEKSKWISHKESKYIVSMASAYKFKPIENLSFQNFIDRILYTEPNVEYYAIGVSSSDEDWQILQSKYPSRVHLTGVLKKEDAHKLIQRATLYMDSFPLGSTTSLLEAISLGIPVLSFASPIQHMDSYRTYSYGNINGLFDETIRILNLSENKRSEIVSEAWKSVKEWHSQKSFYNRIERIDYLREHNPIKLKEFIVSDSYIEEYTNFMYLLLSQEKFRFDNGIKNILNSLENEKLKKISYLLSKNNFFENNLSLYDNIEWFDYIRNKKDYFIQMYISEDFILSESNSVKYLVSENNQIQKFEFDLRKHKNITSLRLDPLNDSCIIEIERIYLISENFDEVNLLPYVLSNNILYFENKYFFEDSDPQISFIDLDINLLDPAEKLCIELKYNYISKDALHQCVKQIMTNKNIIESKNLRLENELAGVYNSKSWKITRPLRYVIKKLKKGYVNNEKKRV